MGGHPWIIRAAIISALLVLLVLAWAILARRLAPASNTARDHFDAILVLGSPADADGNPTPEQLARVTEAVREYERGVAPRLLFTGGPTHNQYVEAEVMASSAAAQGIPPSAILVETRSTDTIHNACYSAAILQSHGWHSAEVISRRSHLPRAAMIFSHTTLQWRMHAAPTLQPADAESNSVAEIIKTVRYLLYANWAERCES